MFIKILLEMYKCSNTFMYIWLSQGNTGKIKNSESGNYFKKGWRYI